MRLFKKMIIGVIDWFLYTLLSENQKKFLVSLVSEKTKAKLKKITKHGKKQAQRMQIKRIKCHLYDLGFTQRALLELEDLHRDSFKDPYMRRLTAWELALWHANKYSIEGADRALEYLQIASEGEKDKDQLRKLGILQAECYEIIGKGETGQQIIHKLLTDQKHPDLYMAASNLEETIDLRVTWINRAMAHYRLQPITFLSNENGISYDDLRTIPLDKTVTEGPKVSVILPAFNFEVGIHIAIESILSQTWLNIELLVVDDCSTDNTVKIVQAYMEKDSRIKLFSTPENSGPYVARNIALKKATGEYVTINDADDWSHAEKIEIQVNHLMNNQTVIANTSEHARLTDDLRLYRRGTPGIYIFSNMSSLMFRREPVMNKLGFWDSVRFAADGEFKRRLIKVFGNQSIVDLKTGPLSLPRQSISSLTGSSAFGYNGFFKGVRKEYVESLEYYHKRTNSFYYSYPQENRPFPAPEPMWPSRENKPNGSRCFDVVIATDFSCMDTISNTINEISAMKEMKKQIGLIQINRYDLAVKKEVNQSIRDLIDGDQIQMLVYGENIETYDLFILDHLVLEDRQIYIPKIIARNIYVIVENLLNGKGLENSLEQVRAYFGKTGVWCTWDSETYEFLIEYYAEQIQAINLPSKNWKELIHTD